ncbi:6-aminohexanoate-cyclic-dimer hydrolase [Patulibacter medicamentivorans]|uniref:6-aminohexanoate-cyclic-dimer hydrolase n=1 Tax=Patulibacter medicamentivorans TaxID=1097667 RepID=H0E165_9ACTN|nr:amidase [Patulibacter medicamentivorans]EHN12585.1 6-aminohexanoate-cyclic-dimer hydrolase [Patulibacter medicamentivorans]
MQHDDYQRYDGLGLAALVADGEVTAGELLDAARARAAAVNPRINAIVRELEPEADARVASDAALSGPFAGVPFVIKDLGQDYAGVPTSGGSRSLATVPAAQHATVVQRWLDAGLVIFGKTNTPEFGAKGITEPELFGPARNPWDLDRTPGGSSGGAAAAVAAGIVPVAGASDGGGSIRIPAACCGLFGLKAGRGLVPSGPLVGEGLHGSATHGVLSRSVRDSAAMLDLLAGADAASPYDAPRPAGPLLDEVGRDPGRLRIGVRVPSAITPDPDPEAHAAVAAAVAALEELGHEVVELPEAPYDDAALAKDFLTSWFVSLAWQVSEIKRRTGCGDEGFERDTLIMAALGRGTSGVAYCDALERRQLHVRRLAEFHAGHDLLLTPTLATPPPRIGEFDLPLPVQRLSDLVLRTRTGGLLRHVGLVDRMIDENLGWVPYTQLANLTGRPAASVPLHWTAAGLPLGVQFVAAPGGEGLLLRLAAQLEAARPWADRRAPL